MTGTVRVRRPSRPGIRAWFALAGAEMKMVVRDTAGLVIPIGLPLLILVMNGLGVSGPGNVVLPGTGGLTVFDVHVMPLVLTTVVATIGVVNMPSFLAHYRKAGVLKRLAVTPAHPAMVLAAQVITSVVQSAVGIALALGAAAAFFDAGLPRSPGLALGVSALAALAMYALGIVIAALAPSGNASVAIGLVAFFAMGAAGGLFGSAQNLPEPVARVGEVLPFGAAMQAVGAAWAGNTPEPVHLLSLAATLVAGGALAARFFRWQ
ncbi:hypothetical protein GCM10010517_29370 [Streptosporangium fragile]|uniref:ABC-2 type transporter transmembrane domain-containing protein n=1 Tax=Streptosporangium fragile TaxID=46186 RepID=A0ABN3VXK5_9ACTN